MNEKNDSFLDITEEKTSKFWKIVGLVVIGLIILSRMDVFDSELKKGFDYTISAERLNVSSSEDLVAILSEYAIDREVLSSELGKIDVSMEEFENNVSIEMLADSDQNGFKGLYVELRSSYDPNMMKSVYDFILSDIEVFVLSKSS